MYTVGSVFYGIYFYVAFPMFYRCVSSPDLSLCASHSHHASYSIDEDVSDRWTVARTATDSLAACMLVTIFLDLWRITLNGISFDTGANTLSFIAP